MTLPNWHLHLSYFVIGLILTCVGWYGVHTWQVEHDARVVAEATIKQNEAQVKTLQDAITQNNQSIAQLQTQMAQRDAANAQIIASLVKAKQTAVTPPQQVQVLATEAKLPAPITSIPNSEDWRLPSVDVQPLFGAVNDGLVAAANLTTCQDDLTDQKSINATQVKTIADQSQQLGLKDGEITALKAKPKFWKRVGHDLKVAAIAAGAVALLLH